MFLSLVRLERYIKSHKPFEVLYSATLILGFHWALVLYYNSNYLGLYFDEKVIALLFSVGSILTCVIFLFSAKILSHIRNKVFLLALALLEMGLLLGLGFAKAPLLIAGIFVIHHAIVPLMVFSIDIFMESIIKDEKKTGTARGGLLFMANIAYAISPLFAGLLIAGDGNNYSIIYLVSAAALVPLIALIIKYFDVFPEDRDEGLSLKEVRGLSKMIANRDVRNVIVAHFLLMLFFVVAVIYMPLYLTEHLGFSAEQLGFILSIALLAYLIFEYPVGRLADTRWGEKEMMAIGFLILAASTALLAVPFAPTVLIWGAILFATRVGASFVEITTESYFFKHVKRKDIDIISLFRALRPISYVIGAPLASFLLLFVSLQMSFVIVGALMILGVFASLSLKDTR